MSELPPVANLICSAHPLQLLPAGPQYFVCSLQTTIPQLKRRHVRKEGTKKVFFGTVDATPVPSFTTKHDNYLREDPAWLMSRNWMQ